ncbi:hypothetical protein [Sporosarcina sp. UB5]|uniref:hypothetical protein n=1 Tax=Sporosarcina sp. UB5 TaxID=3047463 RepID=UPI003D792F49
MEIGDCTILSGHHVLWYEIVRLIDDYFNSRSSSVQIEEDAVPLQKKDWNCYFIPFDARIQMDKLTAKSPLNDVITECITSLSNSPVFLELLDVWRELQEEVFFVNELLNKYKIKAEVNDFLESDLKSFITLVSTMPIMSPIEFKLLLLRLIGEQGLNKRTLIIIELPEIFSGTEELLQLQEYIDKMIKRGISFLIVTSVLKIKGRRNYCLNGQIINEASLLMVKRNVMAEVPYGAEDEYFDIAKNAVLQAVDNHSNNMVDEDIISGYEQPIRIIAYLMLKALNIRQTIDLKGFPPNISKFINRRSVF